MILCFTVLYHTLLEYNTLVFQWSPYQSIPQAVKFDLIQMKTDIIQAKTDGCEY